MAIDSNVLLKAIVPDVVGSAQAGFNLGTSIRNAPLLRQMNEQKVSQNQQVLQEGELGIGDTVSQAVYSLVGDNPITVDNYQQVVTQLQALGAPLEADDFEPSEKNILGLQGMAKRGKGLLTAAGSGKQFADKAVFAERINPQTQKIEQGFAVRDEGGTRFEAIEGDVVKEDPREKRQRDLEAKAEQERRILEIKNSGAALAEQNKQLGAERAKIAEGIRDNARVSRRSKSNALRLKRALDAVNTGRLSVARDLMGDLIPGIKDADAEKFTSLATQYALDELSKQPGVKTDFDYQKAAETQARLGNTKEANKRIVEIALDRMDELEYEEKQFKDFVKNGGREEDFEFQPVPIEFIELIRANPKNEQMKKDFKDKYGYLPSGL